MPDRARTPMALLLALAGGACAEPEPPPAPPPGAVLMVEELPITAAEVERWLPVVALLEPSASLSHQRRLALTNIVLPRAVAAQIDPAAREGARARAEALHGALMEGGAPSSPELEAQELTGGWPHLGLEVWQLARELEPGVWSDVLETVGAYVLVRVLEQPPEPWDARTMPTVERYVIPYLPEEDPRALVLQAQGEMRLRIVDPAWAELVPAHTLDMMNVPNEEQRVR